MSLTYVELALRDGDRYMFRYRFPGSMIGHVISRPTLTEVVQLAGGCESGEIVAVEELSEGVATERKLADIVFGEWFPVKGEIDMAKLKKAAKGATRDVAEDLLGVTKKAVKPAKKVAKKAAATARATFEDTAKIRKVGDRETRPDSNVGKAIGLIKPGMLFKDFRKRMEQTKNPLPPAGILGFLQREGVVKVS